MKRIIMLAASLALAAPLYAQNVATVNGKPSESGSGRNRYPPVARAG